MFFRFLRTVLVWCVPGYEFKENVIVVDSDEKDNTIAPLNLYFLLLGYPIFSQL